MCSNCRETSVNETVRSKIGNHEAHLIHIAAFYDALECMVFLHRTCDADLNCRNSHSFTPLQYACINGSIECADYLLSNGVDPDVCMDDSKLSPLYLTACSGNAKLMEMLFDYEAHLTDEIKSSSHNPLRQALTKTKIDCLEILLSRGFKPMTQVVDRVSPLMQAIINRLFEAVEPLLDKGADPNFTNSQKNCALYLALRQGRPDIVQLLIDRGADIHFIGPGGVNAVHAACQAGNLELLDKVVKMGANPHAKDSKGRLATFSTLTAPISSMIPILTYLIKQCKLDINEKAQGDNTLLLEVLTDSQRMTPELAEFLLSNGANFRDVAANGKTAYEMAMTICSPEVRNVFAMFASRKDTSK